MLQELCERVDIAYHGVLTHLMNCHRQEDPGNVDTNIKIPKVCGRPELFTNDIGWSVQLNIETLSKHEAIFKNKSPEFRFLHNWIVKTTCPKENLFRRQRGRLSRSERRWNTIRHPLEQYKVMYVSLKESAGGKLARINTTCRAVAAAVHADLSRLNTMASCFKTSHI